MTSKMESNNLSVVPKPIPYDLIGYMISKICEFLLYAYADPMSLTFEERLKWLNKLKEEYHKRTGNQFNSKKYIERFKKIIIKRKQKEEQKKVFIRHNSIETQGIWKCDTSNITPSAPSPPNTPSPPNYPGSRKNNLYKDWWDWINKDDVPNSPNSPNSP